MARQNKTPEDEDGNLPPVANNAVNFPKFVGDNKTDLHDDPQKAKKKKKKKVSRATLRLDVEDTEALQNTLNNMITENNMVEAQQYASGQPRSRGNSPDPKDVTN